MTPWTSVVSYHTDPETCGVARFSAQLAARLGVPHLGIFDDWDGRALLSLKFAEFVLGEGVALPPPQFLPHDQLWHDEPPAGYVARSRVWKLYELGVPALVERPVMADRALFCFGMAHKLDLEKFRELRASFPDRQLWISTAEHEGAGPSKVPALVAAWGDGARNLGHLSDAALQLVWPRCEAFVAFFAGGLRANNSSVHAALDAGVMVITNHGPDTPGDLLCCTLDYRALSETIRIGTFASPYTWDRLLKELGCVTR